MTHNDLYQYIYDLVVKEAAAQKLNLARLQSTHWHETTIISYDGPGNYTDNSYAITSIDHDPLAVYIYHNSGIVDLTNENEIIKAIKQRLSEIT